MARHARAPRRRRRLSVARGRRVGIALGVIATVLMGASAGIAGTQGLFSTSDTPADGGVYRTTVQDGKLTKLEFIPDATASASPPGSTGGTASMPSLVVPQTAPTVAPSSAPVSSGSRASSAPASSPSPTAATATTASPSGSAPPAGGAVDEVAAGDWLSGVASDTSASDFGDWRGSKVEIVGTWADRGENQTTPYTVTDGAGQFSGPIDIGVGALLDGESWARAAAGDYDTRWQASLEYMADARAGKGTTYIRFAHESNGDWYPWQVRAGEVGDFKAAWARYTAIQREVFPEARMVFNVNGSSSQDFDWRTTFPGRDVVDVMSVDYYNWYPGVNDAATFASTYARTDSDGAPVGLEAHRKFAASVGLPLAISEWSGAAKFGDNPEYMSLFHDWLSEHGGSGPGQVLYEINFNIGGYDASHELWPDTDQPQAAARYREEF